MYFHTSILKLIIIQQKRVSTHYVKKIKLNIYIYLFITKKFSHFNFEAYHYPPSPKKNKKKVHELYFHTSTLKLIIIQRKKGINRVFFVKINKNFKSKNGLPIIILLFSAF